VLFVSHNLGAVKELCHTAVVLTDGSLTFRGPVAQGIATYTEHLRNATLEPASHGISWRSVRLNNGLSGELTSVPGGEPFRVDAQLYAAEDFDFASFFFTIEDELGKLVVHHRIDTTEMPAKSVAAGTYQVGIDVPALWLAPGVYRVFCKFIGRTSEGAQRHQWSEPVLLDVTGSIAGIRHAMLAPAVRWNVTPSDALAGSEPFVKQPVESAR
jgi:hypothetical protein